MKPLSRFDFPRFLLSRGLNHRIVEVGVDEGEFSNVFYITKEFGEIILVDPWMDAGLQDMMNYKYTLVSTKFSRDPRVKVLRYPSQTAARFFPDGYFDFVYIDALHDEVSVYEDCMAWFPKVKRQGVIAGHDFSLSPVLGAVERFSGKVSHVYHSTDDIPSSWYMIKELD
jgi:hypothetical protein